MHRATLPFASLVTTAALILSGCSDLPPGQTGVFSNNAAVAGGNLARAGGTMSAGAQSGGASTTAMVTATVQVIKTHQATEKQRRIAEQRARAAVAKIRAQQQREVAAAKKKSTAAQKAAPTGTTKKPGTTAATMRDVDPTRIEPAPKKRLPRYIAVDTVKDERTAPQAAKAVMIFDTQTQEIVGNNVYDVRATPSIGGTARFETYTAEYVGSGS